MKRIILCLLSLCLSILTIAQVKFDSLSYEQAIEKANQENKYVFLDFRADWCKPCIEMEQTTFKDVELGDYLKANAISLKIDVDQFSGMDVKEKFNVNQYPSMLLIDPFDEAVQLRLIGFMTAPILMKELNFVMNDIEPKTEEEQDEPVVVDEKVKQKKKCFLTKWLDKVTE